jgi:hypothetical protein
MARDHPWCDKQSTVASKGNPAVTVGSAQGSVASEAGARRCQRLVKDAAIDVLITVNCELERRGGHSHTFQPRYSINHLYTAMDMSAGSYLHARNVHTYPPPSPYHRAALPAYSFAASYLLLPGYIPLSDAL